MSPSSPSCSSRVFTLIGLLSKSKENPLNWLNADYRQWTFLLIYDSGSSPILQEAKRGDGVVWLYSLANKALMTWRVF